MFKRILVPTDGSIGSQEAVHAALEIARLTRGELIALHVVAPPVPDVAFTGLGVIGAPVPLDSAVEPPEPSRDPALVAARRAAHQAGVRFDSAQVVDASPAEAIARTAERCRCDLIVMHSQARGGLLSALKGGTSRAVFDGCDLPLLLIH